MSLISNDIRYQPKTIGKLYQLISDIDFYRLTTPGLFYPCRLPLLPCHHH